MVRSAAALVAILILPSFALSQEPQGTHTVVRYDTLWDLAQRYYSNPFEWRVIWNANRDVVEDPNWIYPAEVLVIPGLPGNAAQPSQPAEPPRQPANEPVTPTTVPPNLVPFGLRQPRPVSEGSRTVFYQQDQVERAIFEASMAREYVAVSPDVAHAAPWLIGLDAEPQRDGVVVGFAGRGARGSSMRMFDEIRITMPSPARVGAQLQLYRRSRTIPTVGEVVSPTGVATVRVIGNGEVVATIEKVYGRILPGDLARGLPGYSPTAGDYAEPVAGGSEAMIMGFAGPQVITDIGHVAFLDLGSDDGIAIGDEFVLYGDAVPTDEDGALQVISTTATTSAARVLSMSDNVWEQGIVVRLARKMR
ncbi:MAG: LysM peptidoglycan-binding domain-containing protein [Gemmatimonadota bacterium]|nr:LysM peptidoglycan-binding domain-containing protein [Gemmatimonadota bacterium]